MFSRRAHIGLSLVLVAIFGRQFLWADDSVTRWLGGAAALCFTFQALALIFRPHWVRKDL